jgi:hypothetical protein
MKINTYIYPLSISGIRSVSVCCILFFIDFFSPQILHAQIGGRYTFAFLKHNPSARITGLNSSQIALRDDDMAFANLNPALLNPAMHKGVAFHYNNLLSDVSNMFVGYAHHVDKLKLTFHTNIQYLNYGTFTAADEFGNVQGNFRASEAAVTIGAGRQLNERFSVGSNLRFITSQLEAYQATGLAADVAGSYFNPDKNFGASITLRNVGAQLSTYLPEADRQNLPYDLQIGFTKKLAKAPFRVSVAAVDLLRWNLRYNNPLESETSLLTGESTEASAFSKTVDNVFRHLRFGGEVVLGKTETFRVRFGYNHQIRREMSVQNIGSSAGFSFGAGVRVKRFRLDWGTLRQHTAGGMNHLTVSTYLGKR